MKSAINLLAVENNHKITIYFIFFIFKDIEKKLEQQLKDIKGFKPLYKDILEKEIKDCNKKRVDLVY